MQLYVSRLNPAALPSSSQLQCLGQDCARHCGYPMTQPVYFSNQLSWYSAVFKPSTFPFYNMETERQNPLALSLSLWQTLLAKRE